MSHSAPDFLAGGGELGGLIREYDWSQTSLGPAGRWPRSLQLAVRIMLASRQPIWIGWGDDLVYLYNDPYKAIVGGKHPEALGRPTRVVWREIWDVIAPMLDTALTGDAGTYVESQLLIMERYGYREETYYTFSYSPIPDDDGGAGGIICANTDDTRRVIGERQLALLRDLGAAATDARSWQEVCARSAGALGGNPRDLPFALVYMTAPGGSHPALAGSAGFAGVEPPEASTWGVADVLGTRELAVVPAPVGVALPTGAWDEPPSHVALVPIPTGETGREGALVVGLNPFRRFDAAYGDFLTLVGGQIAASIATAQAYEAERRRAEALAEIDHAKTVFFSNVSHEFRTPLTLMLGPLEDMLAGEAKLAPADRESLEVVRRNALRLLRMVNTVLDFSRTGASRPTARFRPTELDAVTRELVDRFAPLLARAGLRLDVTLARPPELVYVDGEAWEKIVLNLLSNAFKFTLAGAIRVDLSCDGESVRLRVADTGTGIPDSELPHLFERFHRVRNEQARTNEGTGIGLALVRELVELHGGSIDVESAVGEGTTFTVELPLGYAHLPVEQVDHEQRPYTPAEIANAYAEEAGRWIGIESAAAAPPPEVTPGRARVMVVDDNADMREYVSRLLERHWEVEAHPDGETALEAIRARPPDLVVTDVMMPRLDGFGLLAAVRADPATALLPVIAVSARAGEESSVEGLDAGADDYLIKPFSARELVARVRVSLELARLREEAGRLGALEEVRSRVITTASHELRTPVAAIYGAARTLDQLEGIDQDTRDQLLGVVVRESERLARITSDMLTTEALASGTLATAREAVELDELLRDAVAAARARLPEAAAIRLQDGRPVSVTADRLRLQQVVANLLDNAIKYSPDGGAIDVALEDADGDGTVRIVVADEGIGIPEDAREQVFERFYRVDPELTRGVGGSGLGLFISRELVEAMGGSILVEPNLPRGTRFVVSLPCA